MKKYIFAYGSLMWKPGFEFEEKHTHATLQGFHREFNVKSIVRWGTPEKPGATLGLEEGGECIGMLYQIKEEKFQQVMNYLIKREGPGFEFPEMDIEVTIDGEAMVVKAVVAKYKSTHEGYLGYLDIKERAKFIREAHGSAGSSCGYVESTREHLVELGIDDSFVEEFYQEIKRLPA